MVKYFIFVIITLYLLFKSDANFIETSDIYLSINLKKYINVFRNIDEIEFKLGSNKYKNVVKRYLDMTLICTQNDKLCIEYYINVLKLNVKKYTSLINSKWNIVKVSDKIEKGMPFTLGEYIFLSDKLLLKYYEDMIIKNKKNIIDNCETLIHEKIHIYQRYNQLLFDKFYRKHFGSIKINNLILKKPWKNKLLSNPDGLDVNYVYPYDNKFFLPLLINTKNKLKQIVIELESKKDLLITTKHYMNIDDFKPFKKYSNDISCYHPNEIYAYLISKLIIKNIESFIII